MEFKSESECGWIPTFFASPIVTDFQTHSNSDCNSSFRSGKPHPSFVAVRCYTYTSKQILYTLNSHLL